MLPATRNIVIPQGTTFVETLIVRHPLILDRELTANPTAPPQTLRIVPMPIDLPSGQVLKFPLTGGKYIELVTTSAVVSGGDLVSIEPYRGTTTLPVRASAQTLPKDLTGQAWRGAARAAKGTEPLFPFVCTLDPLNGVVNVRANAAAIAPNCKVGELPIDYQSQGKMSKDLWDKAYIWDIEYKTPAGDIFRVVQGRLWVPGSATNFVA